MSAQSNELKNTTYELFIAALSILSIVNLALGILIQDEDLANVLGIMNFFLSAVFMADFAYRLLTAESKSEYFFRQFGWADLLASMPLEQLKILRVFRLVRVWRLMRQYGARNMLREFVESRAQSALLSLVFLIMLVLEFGGLAILRVEQRAAEANIKTASDAIWYTYVTITTVGYGDRYPVTSWGRFLGVIIMTAGVGLFGTFTGYLANLFLSPKKKEEEEEQKPTGPDDPKARLAELKKLLGEQQKTQAIIEAKIDEIERLL